MEKPDAHLLLERFSLLMKTVRDAVTEAYEHLEIGSAQAKLVRHIGKNSRISQADLARATRTAPTLTGRALEPLVERGLVRRQRSAEDRREYLLELTPAGERVRKRVEEARDGVARRLAGALGERDVQDFGRILAKVLGAFGVDENGA